MADLPPAFKRLEEAMRSLATFNAAGIAGAIGLMQRPGPIALDLRLSALFFVGGLLSVVVAWISGINRDFVMVRRSGALETYQADMSYFIKVMRAMLTPCLFSLVLFLVGVFLAFAGVGGFSDLKL